jgi:hypothetical protein
MNPLTTIWAGHVTQKTHKNDKEINSKGTKFGTLRYRKEHNIKLDIKETM